MTESEPRPNPTEREQTPGANALAQHLQDTFLGRNNELTPDQIRDSGIYLDNTRENTTQRLVAPNGIVDGKRAYQTLGYSPKNNK